LMPGAPGTGSWLSAIFRSRAGRGSGRSASTRPVWILPLQFQPARLLIFRVTGRPSAGPPVASNAGPLPPREAQRLRLAAASHHSCV
jgi:hypothetical protein